MPYREPREALRAGVAREGAVAVAERPGEPGGLTTAAGRKADRSEDTRSATKLPTRPPPGLTRRVGFRTERRGE